MSRHQDLEIFAGVFERFWSAGGGEPESRTLPPAPRFDPHRRSVSIAPLASRRPSDPALDLPDRRDTFSAQEVLSRRDFSELEGEELEAVRRLIRDLRWRVSLRTTRRRRPDRRGSTLDLRRVLRDAAKFGGAPLRLHHLKRKVKPRPLVLLADVSGSMEAYSRLLLQFFFSASQTLRRVECFLFGTRLTRVTEQLKLRNVDQALAQAARQVPDWSGGTRIGESLAQFNRRWGRRLLGRGAVVIVVSDGWERGDTRELEDEMRHLRRRSYRLIWLNPHAGRPGYRPLVSGMAAALPYVDDFLPVHNLDSLRQLASKLALLPVRPTGLPPRHRLESA